VSLSLKERFPLNARTAKSNFALVGSVKAGTTGEEILADLKTGAFGGCAFGNGLVDIPGVTVLGCAP
jgi:hypothetical protein